MRKYWIVPALVVVSVAAWAWSASATTQPQTFSLIEVSVPKNDRALGEFAFDRPPASGDQFVVKNALYKNGARVGHVRVLHTFITGFGPDFKHKATCSSSRSSTCTAGDAGRGVRPGERGRPVEAQVPDRRRHGAICRRARQSGRPQPVARQDAARVPPSALTSPRDPQSSAIASTSTATPGLCGMRPASSIASSRPEQSTT